MLLLVEIEEAFLLNVITAGINMEVGCRKG